MHVRMRRIGRVMGAALTVAVAVGLVTGIVARVLMRLVSLGIGEGVEEVTLMGTVGICLVFTVFALPGALTATARPAIGHAGRWIGAAVLGWGTAQTGITDAQSLVLIDREQLPLIATLPVAFAALVVAHGWLAQYGVRRLVGTTAATGASEPARSPEPVGG